MRRRRECLGCGTRFTTYERIERRPLQVLKRDGSAEDFQRRKLRASIALACAKRPVPPSAIEEMVERIEEAASRSARVEIASAIIGEAVMARLEPLDWIAYIRYASVYRDFQHIDEFQDAVDELTVKASRVERDRLQRELRLDAPGDGP